MNEYQNFPVSPIIPTSEPKRPVKKRRIVIAAVVVMTAAVVFGLTYLLMFQNNKEELSNAAPLFSGSFDGKKDGLITNEYAHWNPRDATAKRSADWEMTSGSLFVKDGAAWTGDLGKVGCAPDAASTTCTNSALFRLNTKQEFTGDTRIDIELKQNKEIHDKNCNSKGTCWYGTHVWTRYQTQYDLYYASVNRADNKVVIKRKVPCGNDNKGTYFVLGQYVAHEWKVGKWQRLSITTQDNSDGSVTIKLYDLDKSSTTPIVAGTDKGGTNPNWSQSCKTEGKYSTAKYTPLRQKGKAGIRGDYADFSFKNFTVSPLEDESAPPPASNPTPTPAPTPTPEPTPTPTADKTAPSVSWTSPAKNATVKGNVDLKATATDDSGVTKVEFYQGDKLLYTDAYAPYSYQWKSDSVADGTYSLKAKAYDGANNTATVTLSVVVKNTVPQPASTPPPASSPSSGIVVTPRTTSQWSSGKCEEFTVKNTGSSTVTWSTTITVQGTITSFWNAKKTQSGTQVAVSGEHWNKTIEAGWSTTFGYCAKY